jgi:hypothetical protein
MRPKQLGSERRIQMISSGARTSPIGKAQTTHIGVQKRALEALATVLREEATPSRPVRFDFGINDITDWKLPHPDGPCCI